MTEAFTDFAVAGGVAPLSFTRTHASNDVSIVNGPPGIFGRGWHHNWEAQLSCSGAGPGSVCTLSRGLARGFQFGYAGTASPADWPSETWTIYTSLSAQGVVSHQNILAKRPKDVQAQRPDDEWFAFLDDGRELHFKKSCDTCSGPTCLEADAGGVARLVKVVDAAGSATSVSYDRAAGKFLILTDPVGHTLELYASDACTANLVRELHYDGNDNVMVRYDYTGADLTSATDADGNVLRSYVPYPGGGGRLQAIKDEAGNPIVEFQYNTTTWEATGVVDATSNAIVTYGNRTASVAESFQGTSGPTSATSVRTFNKLGQLTSVSDSCACGAARNITWSPTGAATCTTDSLGHAVNQELDAFGRITRRTEYAGGSCSAPSPFPAEAREARLAYGLQKLVATNGPTSYAVPLGKATRNLRSTSFTSMGSCTLAPAAAFDPLSNPTAEPGCVGEVHDYSRSTDPAGYACAPDTLPANSVVCRTISLGYVTGSSGPVRDRLVTYFSYDARGRLTRTYGPVSLDRASPNDVPPVEERTYYADGDPTPQNRGRLYQLKRYPSASATALTTVYSYDAFGAFQISTPDGVVTTIQKDGRGRTRYVGRSKGGDQAVTETRYPDATHARLLQVLPSAAAIRTSYDLRGRPSLVEYLSGDPEVSGANPTVAWSESHSYDDSGNRKHSERRDQSGRLTWQQDRAFDVQHRVVQETNPEATSKYKSWNFDTSGFLVNTVDEEARTTAYAADGLNRVQKVTRKGVDSNGLPVSLDVATYSYQTGADALRTVVDGNGFTTTYGADDFGRVERVSSPTPKGGDTTFTYDARGNVATRNDPVTTATYTYDGLDRVTSMAATGGPTYTYGYDERGFAGKLTTIVEPDRTVTYDYDGLGRRKTETVSEVGIATALVTSYAYAVDGSPTTVTYPSGLQVRYDRDPATREVTAVVNQASGLAYATGVTHAPGGPVTGLTFGNGLTLSQGLNLRYEPLTVSSGPERLTYIPSPAGDISQISDTSQVLPSGGACFRSAPRDFKYDFLDRLSSSPNWLSYSYDGNGNRTDETVEGTAATWTYAAGTDRVADRRVGGLKTHAFAYDLQGNLSAVGKYDAGGTIVTSALCLRHDALGRLAVVGTTGTFGVTPDATACTSDSNVTAVQARFKYDASNRRIARWDQASNQWTYTISDPFGNPLSELALLGTNWVKVRDYVWLDGRPLVQIEYPTSTSSYAYYLHVDHIGLPRAMTNQAGQLVWNTQARPFGDILEKTVSDPVSGRVVVTNLRLPGQYDERLLGGLGLQGPYYNWNRWYLPEAGRYLELDPVNLATLSMERNVTGLSATMVYVLDPRLQQPYAYALGSPLSRVDPDGRAVPLALPLLCAAGGCEALANAALAGAAIAGAAILAKLCSEPRPCPPCPDPPPEGKEPPRIDWVPPSAKHYPCPGSHMHIYGWEVNQNPKTCQCFNKPLETVICL